MGKIKALFMKKIEEFANAVNISMEEAQSFAMDHPLNMPVELLVIEYVEHVESPDYSDTPPELGMAGDYEDHDAETDEVLKHIVGE
jgi:hypothetical protein